MDSSERKEKEFLNLVQSKEESRSAFYWGVITLFIGLFSFIDIAGFPLVSSLYTNFGYIILILCGVNFLLFREQRSLSIVAYGSFLICRMIINLIGLEISFIAVQFTIISIGVLLLLLSGRQQYLTSTSLSRNQLDILGASVLGLDSVIPSSTTASSNRRRDAEIVINDKNHSQSSTYYQNNRSKSNFRSKYYNYDNNDAYSLRSRGVRDNINQTPQDRGKDYGNRHEYSVNSGDSHSDKKQSRRTIGSMGSNPIRSGTTSGLSSPAADAANYATHANADSFTSPLDANNTSIYSNGSVNNQGASLTSSGNGLNSSLYSNTSSSISVSVSMQTGGSWDRFNQRRYVASPPRDDFESMRAMNGSLRRIERDAFDVIKPAQIDEEIDALRRSLIDYIKRHIKLFTETIDHILTKMQKIGEDRERLRKQLTFAEDNLFGGDGGGMGRGSRGSMGSSPAFSGYGYGASATPSAPGSSTSVVETQQEALSQVKIALNSYGHEGIKLIDRYEALSQLMLLSNVSGLTSSNLAGRVYYRLQELAEGGTQRRSSLISSAGSGFKGGLGSDSKNGPGSGQRSRSRRGDQYSDVTDAEIFMNVFFHLCDNMGSSGQTYQHRESRFSRVHFSSDIESASRKMLNLPLGHRPAGIHLESGNNSNNNPIYGVHFVDDSDYTFIQLRVQEGNKNYYHAMLLFLLCLRRFDTRDAQPPAGLNKLMKDVVDRFE